LVVIGCQSCRKPGRVIESGMGSYNIEADSHAKGPCLGCGMEVLGPGFILRHSSGEAISPYCSQSCAYQDADADVLGDDFNADECEDAIDEPR